MRISIVSLLFLYMLAGFASAELPTRTLAQGGWFAIGGPIFSLSNPTISTFCNGPCTDENFARAFGHIFTGLTPSLGDAHYHDTRQKAIDALMNGEYSIQTGQVCQPGADSGQAGILISGFARYYTLRDFLFTQLTQPPIGLLPGAENRIQDYTNAISTELNNQNLGPLAPFSADFLVSRSDGQPYNLGTHPISFTMVEIQLYQLIANWASQLGLVVNAFNVAQLRTASFICP